MSTAYFFVVVVGVVAMTNDLTAATLGKNSFFYSIWDPSQWDGTAHTRGRLSLLIYNSLETPSKMDPKESR